MKTKTADTAAIAAAIAAYFNDRGHRFGTPAAIHRGHVADGTVTFQYWGYPARLQVIALSRDEADGIPGEFTATMTTNHYTVTVQGGRGDTNWVARILHDMVRAGFV